MLYESLELKHIIAFIVVVIVLMFLNEVTRRSIKLSIAFYVILPIVIIPLLFLTKIVETTESTGYWFPWVKCYSALAGVIGFMVIRHKKGMVGSKFAIIFPAFILGFNILEAILRDIECYNLDGIYEATYILGGPWNIINAVAGIFCIISITGYTTIYISKDKSKDMIWPDMLWFWIIAYDLWNFAYIYNCIGDRSLYVGLALILSATLAEFIFKKGAWLQHRAQTLALYAMFTLLYPQFAEVDFSAPATLNPTVLLGVSLVALIANVGVFTYQMYTVKTRKINPYTQNCYSHLKEAIKINEQNI